MTPRIKNGETVLVSSIFYWFKNPQIDDIVAVVNEGKVFIKRITMTSDGKYFLEGDNKEDSLDSRKFGFITKEKIIGKVIYKF